MEISGISHPLIEHSRLEGATSGGVLIMGKAQPKFSGSQFINMKPVHIQSSSAYRIDARGNTWQPAASATGVMGDVDYSGAVE
jgi:hypothetical protein